jgi:ribosomal protein S18 acetylase RimI-like enzyme
VYRLEAGPQMVRMWVDRSRFMPADDPGIERLTPADATELNRLYQLGFGAWLPPQAVGEGVYYGLRVNGRLVAAAGTPVVSPAARIGVVGNVLTHGDFRGRGYATAVTGAVTAELLESCDHVVLNVRADNPPAISAYRHLGFVEHVRFEERLARRLESPWSELVGAIRRRLVPRKEPSTR